MDGIGASLAYDRSQRPKPFQQELSSGIFKYIEDDVKVMDHVLKKLQDDKFFKKLFDNHHID